MVATRNSMEGRDWSKVKPGQPGQDFSEKSTWVGLVFILTVMSTVIYLGYFG